jgi:hypothetical protein
VRTIQASDWVMLKPLNSPPVCEAAVASSIALWPPRHQYRTVGIDGVTDPDGDPVAITIDSIFQDEPVNGTGDGNTAPDGRGIGTSTAEVRAERIEGDDGRVYRISFTGDDGSGGTCSGEVTVGVPPNRNGTAVDGGSQYDSTSNG